MSEQQPLEPQSQEPQAGAGEPAAPAAPPEQWTAPIGATGPARVLGTAATPPAGLPAADAAPPVNPWVAPSGYGPSPYAPHPFAPPVQTGVAVDPRRRTRRHAALTGIAAAVLAAAMIGGGVALAGVNDRTTTTAQSTQTRQLPDGDFGFGPGTQRGSQGSDGSLGGSLGGPSGSDPLTDPATGSGQAGATAATAAQQVGVVTIASTLGYSGGASAGTGMVLTSGGIVLTNNHVVDGATSIEVTVESTGKTYSATVLGTDATADVAVLQLKGASGLATVTIDPSGVAAGDTVTAIGNAEGTGNLVAAAGSVTATDQTMTASESGSSSETLSGLIEFSADVVSGDSGGPVLDAQGEVVGITTAASSGSAQTVAYAIDIHNAVKIVKQVEAGDATGGIVLGYPAFLGVELASSGAGALGGPGATIAGVLPGTPSAQVGMLAGDTVTAVDGTTITSASDLSAAMATHAPGDKVTITWTSTTTGASRSATVTLAQGPAA